MYYRKEEQMNNKDWDELEKWQIAKDMQNNQKYGVNIKKIDTKK